MDVAGKLCSTSEYALLIEISPMNDAEPTPAVAELSDVQTLLGKEIDVDAAENLRSETEHDAKSDNACTTPSLNLISLSLVSASMIQNALDMYLLGEEVKRFRTHMIWGFKRSKRTSGDIYSIDKVAIS